MMPQLHTKKVLTPTDLVEIGITKTTRSLAEWRSKNRGPRYVRLESGRVRYVLEDVVEWLHDHSSKNKSTIIHRADHTCEVKKLA